MASVQDRFTRAQGGGRSREAYGDPGLYDMTQEMFDRWRAIQLATQREIRNASRQEEVRTNEQRRRDAAQREAWSQAYKTLGQQTRREQGEETARERRARREGTEGRYERSQGFRESQQEYRERRDRENAARRDAAEAARQQRRDEAARAAGRRAPQLTTGTRGFAPSGGFNPSKESVAKFIIFATVVGAIGAVAHDLKGPTQPKSITTSNGQVVQVPRHLTSLGGVFVAGTLALIVNEFYPGAGLLLGLGIVGLVVIPTWTPLFGKVQKNVFPGPKVVVPGTGANRQQIKPGSEKSAIGGKVVTS